MPQNGARIVREDSEVPSMSEEKTGEQGYFYKELLGKRLKGSSVVTSMVTLHVSLPSFTTAIMLKGSTGYLL